MKLTKGQWTELSSIFHDKFDEVDSVKEHPAASFSSVVAIVEDFLTKRPLDWQPGAPSSEGRYFLITEQVPFPHDYYHYDPDDAEWKTDKVLYHFGPIPPAPKVDKR